MRFLVYLVLLATLGPLPAFANAFSNSQLSQVLFDNLETRAQRSMLRLQGNVADIASQKIPYFEKMRELDDAILSHQGLFTPELLQLSSTISGIRRSHEPLFDRYRAQMARTLPGSPDELELPAKFRAQMDKKALQVIQNERVLPMPNQVQLEAPRSIRDFLRQHQTPRNAFQLSGVSLKSLSEQEHRMLTFFKDRNQFQQSLIPIWKDYYEASEVLKYLDFYSSTHRKWLEKRLASERDQRILSKRLEFRFKTAEVRKGFRHHKVETAKTYRALGGGLGFYDVQSLFLEKGMTSIKPRELRLKKLLPTEDQFEYMALKNFHKKQRKAWKAFVKTWTPLEETHLEAPFRLELRQNEELLKFQERMLDQVLSPSLSPASAHQMPAQVLDDLSVAPATQVTSKGVASEVAASPLLKWKPCLDRRQCVTSYSPTGSSMIPDKNYVDPLRFTGSEDVAWQALEEAAQSLPRTSLVEKAPGYLHFETKSKVFGFVDDLEFFKDPQMPQLFHVRSGARLGYSDFGVNRKRVETIRQKLQLAGV